MKAEPSVNDGRINGTASGNIEGDEVTSWPNHRRGYVQREEKEEEEDDDDDDDDDARPDLTRGQLIRIAAGMLGLMFGWATKTVLTTPVFRNVYGVDPADLGYVWLAGPLSGLVVQPVIGVISDHWEGQGQRSFFFAAGAVIMAVSLALLPAAGSLWRWLCSSSSPSSSSGSEEAGTGLAVAALWLLDLAMNASLVALRAIVADCAPRRQQPEANTVILISYGAGTLLGYGFGTLDIASWLGLPAGAFWKSCVDFWVAAIVLLFGTAVATREAYLLERPHLHAKLQASPSGVTNSADLDFPTAQEGFVVSRGGSSGGGFPPRGVTGGVGEGNERVTGTGIDEAGCSVDVSLEARSGERGGHANGNNSNGESNNNGSHRASYRNNGGNSSSIGNGSSTLNTSTDRSGGEHDAVSDDFTRMSATGFVEVLGRPDDVNAGSAWNIQRGGDDLDVAEWRPQRAITVKEGGDEAFLEGGDAGMTSSNSSLEARTLDMVLFYDVPVWLRPVCLLLFFSWIGWFAVIIFGSDWVGVNVFGGDPSATSGDKLHQAYEDGIAWASIGLALQAVVVTAMGFGPVTFLVRKFGLRGSFCLAASVQSMCLLSAVFVLPGTIGQCVSLLLLAGLGVPLALVESLPYMMVGMFSPRENHGQLLGKLNVWIVLAQLALTLCVHPIVERSKDGDAPVLFAGAIAAAAGLIFVPCIAPKKGDAPVVEQSTSHTPAEGLGNGSGSPTSSHVSLL